MQFETTFFKCDSFRPNKNTAESEYWFHYFVDTIPFRDQCRIDLHNKSTSCNIYNNRFIEIKAGNNAPRNTKHSGTTEVVTKSLVTTTKPPVDDITMCLHFAALN